jgi:hypothetical protein
VTTGAQHADAQEWPWPDSPDALVAAPKHHKLLFENERVRALEVRIPPGDFVPVHTHRRPCVMYVARQSDFLRRDDTGNLLLQTAIYAGVPIARTGFQIASEEIE